MINFGNAGAGNAQGAAAVEHDSMPALELVLDVEQGVGAATEQLYCVVASKLMSLG